MSIGNKVKRLLLARSGGYCGNPECNADLYPLFENSEITNIEELAHIIGQSQNGPRGDEEMETSERDNYENIILLCPKCHTIIDKFPHLYPTDKIKKWKLSHEEKIKNLFNVQKFASREEARQEIEKILITNKIVFETFGPSSSKAMENLIDTEEEWERKSINTIIPNNRKLKALIEGNYNLLRVSEKYIFEEWKQHQECFEYNKLSGDKTASIIIYPPSFNSILNG